MAKIIAIAFSDLHHHDWKQFNEDDRRILVSGTFLLDIFEKAEKYQVPLLFGGDFFHTPSGISTKLFQSTMSLGYRLNKMNVHCIGITGNHDGSGDYSLYQGLSNAFPETFFCIDNTTKSFKPRGFDLPIFVHGIPYLKRNLGLVDRIKEIPIQKGYNILMIHTALYGALDPSGYEVEPQNLPRNFPALFKDFDLVLSGHIHKHTVLNPKIYMVGAPSQQRKSDMNCGMGYLLIYDDFSVKFKKSKAPVFRTYNEGEEHEDTEDFWVEIPKPKKLKKSSEASFKPTMDREKMALRYAKEVGIKNKKKIHTLINILKETDD